MVGNRTQAVTRVLVPFTLANYTAFSLSVNFLVQGRALAETLPTTPILSAGILALGEGTS